MVTKKEKPLNINTSAGVCSGLIDPAGKETIYEIRIKGHLDSTWSEWLDGMEVNLLEDGKTVLSGPIIDQSALMGVLNKLARLNLTIISLNEVKTINHKETE